MIVCFICFLKDDIGSLGLTAMEMAEEQPRLLDLSICMRIYF
jgi:hypothetical protein